MTKPHAPTVHPVTDPGAAHPPAKSPFDPIGGGYGLLFFGLVGILVLSSFTKSKGGKQGTSYWGGKAELNVAKKIGRNQIPAYNGKQSFGPISRRVFQADATYPKPNACCLYLGTPDEIYFAHQAAFYQKLKTELKSIESQIGRAATEKLVAKYQPPQHQSKSDNTLYFPNVQQSIAILGSAGAGKTYSIGNPLIRSALDQGITTIVGDIKYPDQTKEIAGYAAQRGYRVQIIAPSFAETDTLNPYIFVKNSGDSIGAGQLSSVLAKNLAMGDKEAGGFFETAGATVFESSIMTAKWLAEDPLAIAITRRIWQLDENDPLPHISDLLSSAAIHNLSELGNRIRYARHRLNPWNYQSFVQLLSSGSGDAGKKNVTEAGILANAQQTINKLVKLAIIPAICGKSNVEINLDGVNAKTLTIIGLNQDYSQVISPVLAALIDLLVSYNVANARPRTNPLFVSLDEVPQFFLPKLVSWLALARSAGFCCQLLLQNFSQLKETYGDNVADTIVGNCATKFFMNPQHQASAQAYSDYLGTREHRYYTRSTSNQKGSGTTTTRTENVTEIPLIEAAEILKLDRGKAIVISPNYRNSHHKESYVPILLDITVPERDLEESKKSVEVWEQMRASRAKPIDEAATTREFQLRCQLVEALLPIPPAPDKMNLPLTVLMGHLKATGSEFEPFREHNLQIDLTQLVAVPIEFKDPQSPDDAPTLRAFDNPQIIELLCIVVQSTGIKCTIPATKSALKVHATV